jgi:hypothetical protein
MAAAAGVVLEVGVVRKGGEGGGGGGVEVVGQLVADEPLLLPLWLNVNSGAWDVLVRPTHGACEWSDRSLIVKGGSGGLVSNCRER